VHFSLVRVFRAALVAACSAAPVAHVYAAPAPASPAPAALAGVNREAQVLGRAGTLEITREEVLAEAQPALQQQDAEYQRQLAQLRVGYERAHYELVEKELGRVLDKRALQMEAAARHQSTADLLGTVVVPVVTEQEARGFYQSRKARTGQSYEQLAPQISEYLAGRHRDEAMRAFYDRLRAKHGVVALLEPFRQVVAASGPSLGRPDAPVTIVEFADFQCPYCKEAESTLREVLARHPDDVRLVYRYLPLAAIHPNATLAAQAGVCAGQQGRFWPMHDALFADQDALAAPGLTATAQRLGLDPGQFSACLSATATGQAVAADVSSADALGVSGTPAFFINGRFISGNVPPEQFEGVIADELRRRTWHD
jgi:predicted DsbA family dithiol-disulfide isomerase